MYVNSIKMQKPYSVLTAFIFTFASIFLSGASFALDLEHQVKLENVKDTQFNWQQVVPHPSIKNHFFVFSTQGKIHQLINGKMQNQPLLDVNHVLNKESFSLTALTLHPNYALKDLPGYHTFYTAHIERFNNTRRLVRLPKVPLENSEYDLVVTEWQVDLLGKAINLDSKREIIRIASPEQNFHIQQLSFNPYLKPWQDDFGAMFITLNQAKNIADKPLYSGAILRIDPEKFGLRNYTVPESNPFNSVVEIDNEIVALGAQNAKKILWQKRNNKQWLVVEESNEQRNVNLVGFGEDLRQATHKTIWQGDIVDNIHQITWYEGRRISELLYKLITIEFQSGQWYLNSVTIAENKATDKTVIASIPNTHKDSTLGLTTDNNQELLLLNVTDGIISLVKALEVNSKGENADDSDNGVPRDYSEIYFWLAVIVGFALAIYIAIKIKNYDREKALVRKHFNRFQLTNYNEDISLFKRHQKQADVSIPLTNITCNKILLNGEVVSLIDESDDNIFDEQAKSRMNRSFSQEHRLKMVDDRSRVIMIEITEQSGTSHKICLYARRGNQRYTRIDYQECLNLINYWCETISNTMHQQATDEELA